MRRRGSRALVLPQFTFHLGAGEVIKGWDEGVVGMQVGGERLLTVPAPLAYGKRKQADIPANSTLIFGACSPSPHASRQLLADA